MSGIASGMLHASLASARFPGPVPFACVLPQCVSATASAVHAPSMHSVFETLDALLVCVIVDAFAGRAPNVRGVPATNALTSTHAVATTVLPRLSIPPLSAPCHTSAPWPTKQRKELL